MSPQRRLRRFFSSTPINRSGQEITLSEAESLHLGRILRLEKGSTCLLTDETGREAEAVVAGFRDGRAVLTVSVLKESGYRENTLPITVSPALLQRSLMDDLVRKAQELGVQAFQPVETSRTIVKMTAESRSRVADRWRKIVREAAKQSGSLQPMEVFEPIAFKDALSSLRDSELGILFDPNGPESFRDCLEHLEKDKTCHLFWGPEGGFSKEEAALAQSMKCRIVNLGKSILKADTAFLGVTASLRFFL